jgi:thiamine biosynthesis lipoprotein
MRAALLLPALVAFAGCAPEPARFAGETMGTTYHATVSRLPAGVDRAVVQASIDEVLLDVDRHLSTWSPSSELAQFNAAPGDDWVAVSPQLLDAVKQSRLLSEMTGGAFDATVSPLVRAWGFGAGGVSGGMPPDAAELQRLSGVVGYQRLELREDPRALRKSVEGLQVDLDGFVPGLAVDRVAEELEGLGIVDYLFELGGEVRARGRSPAGRPWRVAVEAPVTGERRPIDVIEIDGLGVSTSGDYRDFRDVGGRRISHTVDPRSGAPVDHRLTSVTVVHPSAAMADGLATAMMVLGREDGEPLARRLGLAVLFIERGADGGLVQTETEPFARLRRSPE